MTHESTLPQEMPLSERLLYGLTDAVGLFVKIKTVGGESINHEFDRGEIKQLISALRSQSPAEKAPEVATLLRHYADELTKQSPILHPTAIAANLLAIADRLDHPARKKIPVESRFGYEMSDECKRDIDLIERRGLRLK